MKKQSVFAYVVKLSVTLLLITGITAAALAGINSVTAPIIAQINAEKTQQAIEAVLPGGGEKLDSFSDEGGIVSAVYASESGYAVEVNPAGFNGAVKMMVGVSKDGKVLNISVVSHTETAGLGAVAAAKTSAGETFRGQFAGKSGVLAVTADGGEIDAITGATITSRAVTEGINAALSCVEQLG